jgi:putative ABC transport system permease protein
VVILTHNLWQNRFGGDPGLLGRSLTLNGIRRRVIGILPPGATLGRAQLFVPMVVSPNASRTIHGLGGVARLRPNITIEQAQRELDALTRQMNQRYPQAYPPSVGHGANVVSMHDTIVGDVRPALFILLGTVGLVLLIACANVANLLLARGEARQREMAVRLALGATRRRIVAQLLTESVLLALIGAALGAVLARWGMTTLLAVNPDAVPRAQEIRLDATVGLVTLGLALLTGVLFGLAPATQLVRAELQSRLQEASRGSESGSRQRLGRALVAAEIALAVVVVIGAALLMRSFWTLRNVDPGFHPDNLLTIDLAVPEARYDDTATTIFYRRLVERMAALPGVQVAAAASDLPPAAGQYIWDVFIEGRPIPPGQAAPTPNMRAVTRDYFRAMSIAILRGRGFGRDDHETSPPVAVINETAARTIWGSATNAVGTRFRFDESLPWITVVGVARDARSQGLAQPAPAEVFVLHEQLVTAGGQTERAMLVVLRTLGDPTALAAPARRVVAELDPLLAIIAMRSMTEMISLSVARPRFTMLLLGVFGGVALTLAAIGIFGVMSYAVRRRTREIGIRMALGAQPGAVLRLVVGQGMRLALVGLAVGITAAFLATRLMASMLYGVSARDPWTFGGTGLLLAAVALVASWLPARRAMRADAAVTLRGE